MLGTSIPIPNGLSVRHDRGVALTRTQAREETHHLGHVRLYRDELDEIIRVVSEVGEPAIEGPGFTATTAQDLADPAVPENLEWLTIAAREGEHQIRITLTRDRAVAELTEPNTLLQGVLSRVFVLCQRSRRPGKLNVAIGPLHSNAARHVRWVPKIILGLTSIALPTFVLAVLYTEYLMTKPSLVHGAEHPPSQNVVGALLVGLLVMLASGLLMEWSFGERSSAVLINAYRAERPTFWQRKRDDLIINAVSLLLGAILGVIATKIMG